tara:strand:+ start:331 stop:510 length:180 start_codon:yes stop_codon:yes gene_type:complete
MKEKLKLHWDLVKKDSGIDEVIYGYLEKGTDGLGRNIRYIKEENLPSLIKDIKLIVNNK